MSTTTNADPTAELREPILLALTNRLSDVRGRLQEQANRTQAAASKLSGSDTKGPSLPKADDIAACYVMAINQEINLLVTALETLYSANSDLDSVI